jgi:FKBP-type peptidyl-prolyl cis-trans isomerase
MKNVMIIAAALCTALASCQGAKNMKSYSALDSMAYAYGVNVASNLRMQDSTMNSAAFAAAFQDVFNGKAAMTMEESYEFLNNWFNVRKPEMDKAANQTWFDEVKAANPNIQTTASGLMYEIISAGDQTVKATADNDQVVASYVGTLKDGTEFDRNDSIPFALNGVIRGWTEGMKLIGKGGEIVLWVPSDLGYGPQGGGPIPPNAALKFEVKLIDVIPAEPAPVVE